MKKQNREKPFLILDLPFAAKVEGLAWAAGAGFSGGGLAAKFTPAVWHLLGFSTALAPELATLVIGGGTMMWAMDRAGDIMSDDLARRHGLTLREMRPPRWDISKLNIF